MCVCKNVRVPYNMPSRKRILCCQLSCGAHGGCNCFVFTTVTMIETKRDTFILFYLNDMHSSLNTVKLNRISVTHSKKYKT